MSTTSYCCEVSRIVVAIDSSTHAAAAADSAATLAAQFHAELEGIFVQDVNLARLAALPIGREIRFLTGEARDFTTEALNMQNREQETSARNALSAAADRARISHEFHVIQGHIELEVLNAAKNADLLILGIGDFPGTRGLSLGVTPRSLAEQVSSSVLISKPNSQNLTEPLVWYDGTAGARRALDAAIQVTGTTRGDITVLVVAQDLDRAAILRKEVDERLGQAHRVPRFLHSARPTPDQICRLVTEVKAGILIVGADSLPDNGRPRLRLIETATCSVLIIR
jgi:nucleotide-binding universal stress UspA family protein